MKHIARTLRRNQTDAERLLWYRLQSGRFSGLKFRRQMVLGPYVVDFACLDPKLIIEVDGGQHAEQALNDAARTRYLEAFGYTVMRFWNDEVLRDSDRVLEEIGRVLNLIPSPYPLPEGEGRKASGSLYGREQGKRRSCEVEKKGRTLVRRSGKMIEAFAGGKGEKTEALSIDARLSLSLRERARYRPLPSERDLPLSLYLRESPFFFPLPQGESFLFPLPQGELYLFPSPSGRG